MQCQRLDCLAAKEHIQNGSCSGSLHLITFMVNYYYLKDTFTLANEKLSGDEQLCLLNTLTVFSKSDDCDNVFSSPQKCVTAFDFFFQCNW